jgi:hypothetical protein
MGVEEANFIYRDKAGNIHGVWLFFNPADQRSSFIASDSREEIAVIDSVLGPISVFHIHGEPTSFAALLLMCDASVQLWLESGQSEDVALMEAIAAASAVDCSENMTSGTTPSLPPRTTSTSLGTSDAAGAAATIAATIEGVDGIVISGWAEDQGQAYASLSYQRTGRSVILAVFPTESTMDGLSFLYESGPLPYPDTVEEYGPVRVASYDGVDTAIGNVLANAVQIEGACSGFVIWFVDQSGGVIDDLRADARDYLNVDPCRD